MKPIDQARSSATQLGMTVVLGRTDRTKPLRVVNKNEHRLVPHNHSAILRCLMGLYDSSGPAFYNGPRGWIQRSGTTKLQRPTFSVRSFGWRSYTFSFFFVWSNEIFLATRSWACGLRTFAWIFFLLTIMQRDM